MKLEGGPVLKAKILFYLATGAGKGAFSVNPPTVAGGIEKGSPTVRSRPGWSLISTDRRAGTRAEFSYHRTPVTIATGKGSISVGKDLQAALRQIESWHQAPITNSG